MIPNPKEEIPVPDEAMKNIATRAMEVLWRPKLWSICTNHELIITLQLQFEIEKDIKYIKVTVTDRKDHPSFGFILTTKTQVVL